jgi:hypothetical protein
MAEGMPAAKMMIPVVMRRFLIKGEPFCWALFCPYPWEPSFHSNSRSDFYKASSLSLDHWLKNGMMAERGDLVVLFD